MLYEPAIDTRLETTLMNNLHFEELPNYKNAIRTGVFELNLELIKKFFNLIAVLFLYF